MDRGAVLAAYRNASRWRRDNPAARRGLLVGQAAPRNPAHGSGHALFPFPSNCAGARLFKMGGWGLMPWFAHWDRINTIQSFPGGAASGKGDAFPLPLARECAQRHFGEMRLWNRVCVFVGKANASCYAWDAEALPEPLTLHPQRGGGTWAWVPHTSGVVPFWNDPAHRDQLRQMFDVLGQIILPVSQKSS